MKSLKVIVLAGLLATGAMQARAADVTVTVPNVTAKGGDMRVVLYSDAADWLTHHGIVVRDAPAQPGQMSFTFKNVQPGSYAILAYQDVNRNKDLDVNFLGIPEEPFGFSNNPGFSHKPDFKESDFQVGQDAVSLTIDLSE